MTRHKLKIWKSRNGIKLARDVIWAAGQRGQGCGILDTDLIAGFDYMNLSWCLKVLEKKGAAKGFLQRLTNLYSNNLSVVVVNNVAGAAVENLRLTLGQGDTQGIIITSTPVVGPTKEHKAAFRTQSNHGRQGSSSPSPREGGPSTAMLSPRYGSAPSA